MPRASGRAERDARRAGTVARMAERKLTSSQLVPVEQNRHEVSTAHAQGVVALTKQRNPQRTWSTPSGLVAPARLRHLGDDARALVLVLNELARFLRAAGGEASQLESRPGGGTRRAGEARGTHLGDVGRLCRKVALGDSDDGALVGNGARDDEDQAEDDLRGGSREVGSARARAREGGSAGED